MRYFNMRLRSAVFSPRLLSYAYSSNWVARIETQWGQPFGAGPSPAPPHAMVLLQLTSHIGQTHVLIKLYKYNSYFSIIPALEYTQYCNHSTYMYLQNATGTEARPGSVVAPT